MAGGRRAMMKTASTLARRHVIRFSLKLVIFLSVSLCVLALFRLHFQSDILSSTPLRSRNFHENFKGPPKIAFLFLVRQNLPLDFLWGAFLEVLFFLFLVKFHRFFYLGKWVEVMVFWFELCGCRMLTLRNFQFISIRLLALCSMRRLRDRLSFTVDNWVIAFR